MPAGLKELITAAQIQERVCELGFALSSEYRGREVRVIVVLKGAAMFAADLLRNMEGDITVDFIQVASYGACTTSRGRHELRKDLDTPIVGRDVLVVEDVIDGGGTLNFLRRHLLAQDPRSLTVCALLDKPADRRADVRPDKWGFSIGKEFVVGYGLDFAERFRQLPAIYAWEPGPS